MRAQHFAVSSFVSFLLVITGATADVAASVPYIPQPCVLIQKNCVPGELTITKEGGVQTVSTTCTWQKRGADGKQPAKDDSDMQINLYIKENIFHVKAYCIFTPIISSQGGYDRVVDISTSEAARFSPMPTSVPFPLPNNYFNISYSDNMSGTQAIEFAFSLSRHKKYYDEHSKSYRANIIFNLNINSKSRWPNTSYEKPSFNPGDKLTCNFWPTETLELPK
jgi:hypothetical protein